MLLKKSRKSRFEDAVDRAREQAGGLADRVAPHVEHARDRILDDYLPAASGAVAGAVAGAREGVPVVQEAAADASGRARQNYRDIVRPAAKEAYEYTRDVRVPAAREALAEARDKAVPAAEAALLAAQERAREKAEEMQASMPRGKKKSGKGKKLLLGLGVIGVGAGVAKLLQGRRQQRTLPYVPPTPAPRTTTADAAADPASPTATGGAASAAAAASAGTGATARPDNLGTDMPAGPQEVAADSTDAGGSTPGEALSDEHDGPHPVTTPDSPAEHETLDDPRT